MARTIFMCARGASVIGLAYEKAPAFGPGLFDHVCRLSGVRLV